ncbi:unnamed protein product [Phytomonas sp. Hart1]|nr:unnamed protein product [Phytomonas sp. Hart1]|eukprot:CCW66629.1 unnamed protein product [Phytomonas sp. isolate Hart1]
MSERVTSNKEESETSLSDPFFLPQSRWLIPKHGKSSTANRHPVLPELTSIGSVNKSSLKSLGKETTTSVLKSSTLSTAHGSDSVVNSLSISMGKRCSELHDNISSSRFLGINTRISATTSNADTRAPVGERQTTSFAPNVNISQPTNNGLHSRSLTQSQRQLSRSSGWASSVGVFTGIYATGGLIPPTKSSNNEAVNSNNVYMVHLSGDDGGVEMSLAQPFLQRVAELRGRYKGIDKGQPEEPLCMEQRLVPPISLHISDGVYLFGGQITIPVSWEQFYDDFMTVCECMQHTTCQSACLYRLQVLEEKYDMYRLSNNAFEENNTHNRPYGGSGGGVFNKNMKVDNGVMLHGMVSAPRLVDYIREVIRTRGEDDTAAVLGDQKTPYNLRMVYEMLNFTDLSSLTADDLGLQPSLVEKTDRFYDPLDAQCNHAGTNAAALLHLFLTRDNLNRGAYFADVIRPFLVQNAERLRCPKAAEVFLSVTGVIPNEWENLAQWLQRHNLLEPYRSTNQYLVTLSRKRQGSKDAQRRQWRGGAGSDSIVEETPTTDINNIGAQQLLVSPAQLMHEHHQQHLDQLFLPLFMATIVPEDPRNTALATLLECLGGFVITPEYEENEQSAPVERQRRRPVDVPSSERVSDIYFAYYLWANLTSLNALRRRRGLNTFQLRSSGIGPSSSSSSPTLSHTLVLSYLLCDGIYHPTTLEEHPVLQYLYGLHHIGVCISPLSSTAFGFSTYADNPFMTFFRRGLQTSLCTYNPLAVHHSDDPLVEEYGMACKLYHLSGVDVSEIALNSVMNSSFPNRIKSSWLGEAFINEGWRGNLHELSNVPTSRLMLRHDMWANEYEIIFNPMKRKSASPAAGVVGRSEEDALRINPTRCRIPAETTMNNAAALSSAPPPSIFPSPSPLFLNLPISGEETTPTDATATLQAPYAVTDPHVKFPRVQLIGPYDRDAKYAWIGQALLRALETRSFYVSPYSNEKNTREDSHIKSASAENTKDAPRKWHEVVMQQYYTTQNIEQAFRRDDHSFEEDEWMFKTVDGVVVPHEVHQIPRLPQDMCQYDDFRVHVQDLKSLTENYLVSQFAQRRLQLLEHRFLLHQAVNHGLEAGRTAEKASQNRDFYQSTKVDNTIRTEAGMTARQLLQFIVHKARNSGDDIVWHKDGKEPQTLRQLLHKLHISPDSLTVDDLNVQIDMNLGGAAAEASNAALYTPEGRDELLTLLLKTDNHLRGRYFAELTKLTFDNLERDRFSFTEFRLTIYGARSDEWALLSSWFDTHGMSSSHNCWVIQVPCIYGYLHRSGRVRSFAEYLENIFTPLWLVSLHPSKDPRLFHHLTHISGFDMVSDERWPDLPMNLATRPPHEWTTGDDPPYNYYQYYLWANIYSLNAFRRRRKFSVFSFCPSSGESGPAEHLIGSFLLAHNITYGVQLETDPVLEYLFYLAQIGITMCPLSNNTKVCPYLQNPFPRFFQRGLRISLGTDCPLQFHHTQEPLLEEYSIASKVWKLSPNDMCEIARNSVLLSGFSPAFKQEHLGRLYFLSSSLSNEQSRTHLSDIRVAYRFETYHTEVGYLEYVSGQVLPNKAMLTQKEEDCEIEQLNAAEELRQKEEKQPNVLLGVGGGIIDAESDAADISQLQAQRKLLRTQLDELTQNVHALQHRNHQLTEKLQEERRRTLQAERLKRQKHQDQFMDISLDCLEELLKSSTTDMDDPLPQRNSVSEVPYSNESPYSNSSGIDNVLNSSNPLNNSPSTQLFVNTELGNPENLKMSDKEIRIAVNTDAVLPHIFNPAVPLESANGAKP